MRIIKTLFNTAVAALAAMAVSACDNKPGEGGDDLKLNEALELSVDVEDITAKSAKIKVSHNGEKSDTWYGFLTEDVTTDEEDLIEDAVTDYMDGNSAEGLRKSKNYVSVINGLKSETSYRYIAFGLSSEGQVYGSSGSIEFTTEPSTPSGGENPGGNNPGGENPGGDNPGGENPGGDDVVDGMKVNPAWTVTYSGEGVVNGEKHEHVVTVKSTDNRPYVITIVYASNFEELDLYNMAYGFVQDLKDYVDQFNYENGTSYTVADILFTGDGADYFDLYPGYYRAMAIGITDEGKVSGYYAVSEMFEVKEPVATEEYKAWLGEWTFVGDNGAEYPVKLSRHIANKSFWLDGWEGYNDLPVLVEYDSELDALFFYSQKVAEDVDFGEYGYADIYFLGGDEDGYFYTNKEGDYYIAIAGILDNGQRALVRYGRTGIEGYPVFTQMFYMAEFSDGYYSLTDENEIPTFPAAINPYEAPQSRKGMMKSKRMASVPTVKTIASKRPMK